MCKGGMGYIYKRNNNPSLSSYGINFLSLFFLYPFHHLNCPCHLLSEKISGWVGSLVMQHSTPKIKKNKKLSIHFQKGFEEKERKKRSSQIESKNLFFFSTQLKRESDHFPLLSLSLHPFRLLSSTHTQGNKTFVTNEIRVSPSFSLFFRERSFHFHFPLLCAVIIMVGPPLFGRASAFPCIQP